MALPPLRLISFDLDDTIVDSEARTPARLKALGAALRGAGVRREPAEWDAALAAALAAEPVLGGRFVPYLATLGLDPESGDTPVRAAREAYDAALYEGLGAFPDAFDVLSQLKPHYRIAVTTNGPPAMQRRKLALSGIEGLLDAAIVSGEVGVWKPDPAIFGHTCRAAGVRASEAAHVGDSLLSDIAGARAAGLVAIWRRPSPDALPGSDTPDAVILNGVLKRGSGAFASSTFLLLVAAFSTSQRGLLMVAVAASAIAVGLYVLRSSPGRAVSMVLVGGLLLTVFFEAVPVLQQIAPGPTERLSEGFGALSYQSRVAEAEDAFAAWKGQVYGLGFGASIPVRAEVEYEITGPRLVYVTSTFIHNSYAWYLAKMGLQGLVAVVLLVGVSSWTAFRRFTKDDHQVEAMAALMLLALSAGGAIGGPALHGFYYTSWVAIAIVLATAESEAAPRPQTSRRSRWSRSVALDGSRSPVV